MFNVIPNKRLIEISRFARNDNHSFIIRKEAGLVTERSRSAASLLLATSANCHFERIARNLDISLRDFTKNSNTPNVRAIDNNGNIYVFGAAYNDTTGLDISIYKFNDDLELLWEQHFDGYEGEDKGFGVKTDDAGNVYAVGYVTNPNQGKNYAILKYDSTGDLQWSREFNGLANQDDEAVQLVVREDRIFVTGAARNGTNSEIVTMGYTAEGEIFSVKTYDSPFGLNDKPTDMGIDLDNNLIVVGQIQENDTTFRNVTVKYNVMEKPIVPIYVDSVPAYNARELIVRFDKTAMNLDAVDKKNFDAGLLKDFVHEDVIDSLNAKFPFDAGRLQAFKIFHRMTTADSLSITRLGDTVKIDDFWATISIYMPSDDDNLYAAIDTLTSFFPLIQFGELNYFGEFFNIPNDALYHTGQSGFYDSGHGINLEQAWQRQVGQNYVKVGIFDTGINWRHEDFGDGTWNGSKVKGGWDYFRHAFVSNLTNPDSTGHGTHVAGVCGALRNNHIGITGVAGGDYLTGNTGCQLYSSGIPIFLPPQQLGSDQMNTMFSLAVPAIIEGAVNNPYTGYGYGFHIQNHSWGSYSNSIFLRNAVKTCYEQNCIFVASSGNKDEGSARYPASYNDNWVLKVGASDATGTRVLWSTYGNNLDILAPGTANTTTSLDFSTDSSYLSSWGTSISAPHVTGVAALLYSEHNLLTNVEYPNSLAPDDIEMILKKTAFPITVNYPYNINLTVPNQYAGYGRLNAGDAITLTSLPHRVRHFEHWISTSNSVLHSSNQLIQFPENIHNLPISFIPGFTDIYKLEVTLNHNISSNETYLDGWVRNSSCDLFGITNELFNPHWSEVTMLNSNHNSATLVGYIYKTKIHNAIGQHVQDRWFPVDLNSSVKFSYSIHTIDNNPNVGSNSILDVVGFNLYPNPTSGQLIIAFDKKHSDFTIEIYDVSGRNIETFYSDEFNNLEYSQKTMDITNYQSGVYICVVKIENKLYTRKFIKN